jgi:pyruvate dehydrogenase E1 component beta subunit
VGAEIAAFVQEEAFDDVDAPIQRVASLEVPLPYAKGLETAALTGAKQLLEAISKVAPRRRRGEPR